MSVNAVQLLLTCPVPCLQECTVCRVRCMLWGACSGARCATAGLCCLHVLYKLASLSCVISASLLYVGVLLVSVLVG